MNDTHLGAELLELLGELRPRHLEWRDCKVRAVLAPSQKVALGHAVIEEHGRVFGADGTADMVHIDRVRNQRHSEEAINRQSRGNQEAIDRQSRGNQEAIKRQSRGNQEALKRHSRGTQEVIKRQS